MSKAEINTERKKPNARKFVNNILYPWSITEKGLLSKQLAYCLPCINVNVCVGVYVCMCECCVHGVRGVYV